MVIFSSYPTTIWENFKSFFPLRFCKFNKGQVSHHDAGIVNSGTPKYIALRDKQRVAGVVYRQTKHFRIV